MYIHLILFIVTCPNILSVDYEIQVETGDKRFAGTDADVFITLYGKKRSSRKYQLTKKGTNLFEGGNTDVFHHLKQVDDIGTLTKVR